MKDVTTSSPAKGWGAADVSAANKMAVKDCSSSSINTLREVDVHTYEGSYEAFNANWMNEQNIQIDWHITERNKHWHDTYFTRRSVKDHQAKGNCRFVYRCIEELEHQKWINPGDVVFDPMCGIGSFLVVAALKGYDGLGIELEERFYKDMLGYDEHIEIDEKDDLFAGFVNKQHVEGNIEKFHRLTSKVPKIGRIAIIKGDARVAYEILKQSQLPVLLAIKQQKLVTVLSPPYGNRLRDITQVASADDELDWSKIDTDHDRQYSNDGDNIGTHKIVTISSPPYSRSTEHNASQIDALPDEKVGGHKGFCYTNRKNIALLKLGQYDIAMLNVYKSLYKTVGIGSPVVLLTRNFIQEGKIVLLDELTIKLMEQAGFTYKFTKRAELPEISMFKYMNWNNCHKEKQLPLITWEEATFYLKEY